MAGAGSGLGQLLPLAMLLVGVVGIVRARRARKRGETDRTVEDRRAATLETERRMAAYLAQRDGGGYRAVNDRDGRENGP